MRITFVLPDAGIAGGIRVVATYAEQLQKRGHQVCVVCLPSRPIPLRDQVKSLLRGEGWILSEPSQHFEGKAIQKKVVDRWRPITANDVPDADVVIATWWETAEWVAQFPASKGTKVYFIQHYEALLAGQPSERVKATWHLPMHKIVVSRWLAGLAQAECGSRVTLVPNSVSTEQFFAPPRGKQSIPTVGLMYSRVHWKGSALSLQAFSLAAQAIPNLRLVAFGSGSPSPQLPLPKGTKYISRPAQAKIKDIYAQCDAWLFGSSIEGFGLPILEAMACRTPVIGTPAGAAPELLQQGAGILVKPEDSENMAQAIEQICRMTNQEWRTMSQVAYARATSYTWNDATSLFEAALQRAVERSHQKNLVEDLV